MKRLNLFVLILFSSMFCFAQSPKTIQLNQPEKDKGFTVLKALSLRASASDFNPRKIELQDLSNLLWAANGINRPDEGKRTAPSAINAQDIDIYVFLPEAVYLFNARENILSLVKEGDFRSHIAVQQQYVSKAPVICLMVSDVSRFRMNDEQQMLNMAALDAGIVSQNISLFCSSVGMITRPRIFMDQEKLREILQLKETQHIMINHPVSYAL